MCDSFSYDPTTCVHGIVPKFPQLSRLTMQTVLDVEFALFNFFVFPRPTCRSIRQHVRYLTDLHIHFCKDWGVSSKPHPIRKPRRNQHQCIASALGKVSLLGLSKTNEAENTSLAHAYCNVEFELSPIDPTIYPLY